MCCWSAMLLGVANQTKFTTGCGGRWVKGVSVSSLNNTILKGGSTKQYETLIRSTATNFRTIEEYDDKINRKCIGGLYLGA